MPPPPVLVASELSSSVAAGASEEYVDGAGPVPAAPASASAFWASSTCFMCAS